MDLAKFDPAANAEQGATVHLRNPLTNEPLMLDGEPVTISVLGADGETFRSARASAQFALAATGLGTSEVARSTSNYRAAVEEQASNVLAAVTTGWERIKVDDEMWTFNEEAARHLYDRFEWIRQQVGDAVNDRRRFYQGDPADLQPAA
jgi:hypothetical protein